MSDGMPGEGAGDDRMPQCATGACMQLRAEVFAYRCALAKIARLPCREGVKMIELASEVLEG